jgi:PhnB protein
MTPIPPITPYLFVSDAAAAIEFYKKGFGAVQDGEVHIMPGTDKIMHARLLINGSMIMLSDEFPQGGAKSETPDALGGSPIVLAVQLEGGVQDFWDKVVAAGATVTMPLADQFWGAKYGQLTDPFGHKWSVSQETKSMTDEEMKQAAETMLEEKGTLMGSPDAA